MKKIVAIDFDGTIIKYVKDSYLYTNFDLMPNVKEVITWINQRFYTILWTCRCGWQLEVALNFLNSNDITFHSINQNAPFLDFKTSRKIFADTYIDDRTLIGIDWLKIKDCLIKKYYDPIEQIVEKVIEVQ